MVPLIEIEYRNLPKGIFQHLKNSIIIENSHFSVNRVDDSFSNFDGGPPDTIFTVNLFLLGLLNNSFLYPGIYDLLKGSIIFLWKKTRNHYYTRKGALEKDKNYISLEFKISQDKAIEFRLEGNISDDGVAQLTDKLFLYLKNGDKVREDLKTYSCKSDDEDSHKFSLEIDQSSNDWNPINFEELKQRRREKLRDILDELES